MTRSTTLVKCITLSLLLFVSGCEDADLLKRETGTSIGDLSTQSTSGVDITSTGPRILIPNLMVKPVISGLFTPIGAAFLDANEMLVLEKNTGKVLRIVGGEIQNVALDLAVNFASERGLLSIALHPNFQSNKKVYLYWTESTSGTDTNVLSETSLLGNRVDIFLWDAATHTLTQESNVIRIRALQEDAGQPARGNHDGGVIRFGPDGKLYIFVGDVGRRGQLQNLPCGPTDVCPGETVPDDQFGGPEPDNAHLTGVILRLNDDGTAPADNPFYNFGASKGGEVGANIQKIFSYGHRNSFGMAFDPYSKNLWLQENGDDSFSEINRVPAGMNGGWVQIMGPVSRIAQYKAIETDPNFFGLQQLRWSPENIADSPQEALSRLFMLPGSKYVDPEMSWKFEVAPGGIAFVKGKALGQQLDGTLILGAARDALRGGHLFRLRLTGNRNRIAVDDPRLADRVADNTAKFNITESESLLIGENFGVVTDIQMTPNGTLLLVSISHGSIYEIMSRK